MSRAWGKGKAYLIVRYLLSAVVNTLSGIKIGPLKPWGFFGPLFSATQSLLPATQSSEPLALSCRWCLSGRNPSGVMYPQYLQDACPVLHASREGYVFWIGQFNFRPEHVVPTPGDQLRIHFPARMSGVC